MTEVKRGFWIVALVIVMGLLVAAAWAYGMFSDEFQDVLLSFFETTAAPTESATAQTPPPQTTPPTTVPETVITETTLPETDPPTAPTTEPVATTEPPLVISGLKADHAIVFDTATGETLYYQSNGTDKVYPASITKVFTAYVALRYLAPEEHITAGDELDLLHKDSSKAGIQKGQSTSVENMLYGLIMPSGSDVAYTLAAAAGRKIGGSDLTAAEAVQVFVDEMNAQARDLGMNGSHFSNPDGYHSGSHYICLEDAVTIARLALENPTLAKCSSTLKVRVELDDGTVRTWENRNKLLNPNTKYYNEAFCGLKTGHTNNAGCCVLSAVKQEEGYLIIGVFGCPKLDDRFADAYRLAKYFGRIA